MKIVKIGAMWCPGCIVMKKIWDEILKENPDIELTSLDIDMDDVIEYNVGNTLPVIIFYKNNNEYKRLIGEKRKIDIENIINEIRV